MKGYTLITGASTGIGKALAEDFASQGKNLVLVARSTGLLETLASRLASTCRVDVRVCPADLSHPEAPEKVFAFCREAGLEIETLVNCAGFSVSGGFIASPPEDLRQMAMVNMVSLTGLTRLLLPGMVSRKCGSVVNIASLSAFQGVPGMSAYSASKSFVVTLTEGLAVELRGSGVRVFAVCPGFIDNEQFYKRAGHDRSRIMSPVSPPSVVVRAVRRGLRGRGIVVFPTFFDSLMVFTQRFVPRRLVVAIAGFLAGAAEEKHVL